MIDKDLKYIHDHFGKADQDLKYQEEDKEYNEAYTACCLDMGQSLDDLIDETADKIVLMLQRVIFFGGSVSDVVSRVMYKVVRTKKRISQGYYNETK